MRKSLFAGCCLALCLHFSVMNASNDTLELRIIQTSDVHGCFFPYDYINRKPKAGTLARVSSYVNRLRQQYGQNLLLFDNGDILQGQPISYYSNFVDTTEMNIAAAVVNYLHYDAQTIGNHDVETGHKVYDKWVKEVSCPVLGANVVNEKTGRPYLKPYIILNRNGVKIAVLGLLTPAIPNWLEKRIWSNLAFTEMVKSAKEWMKIIKEEHHPDVVIGLFHSGWEGGITTPDYAENASKQVASEVPGFDLVLFGHDHTRYLETISNKDGHEVLCMDPANNAMTVADATLTLEKKHGKWQLTDKKGQLYNVTKEEVDTAFLDRFSDYNSRFETFANTVIGRSKHTIDVADSFFGNSAFGDFILNMELQLTGADIAFNAPLSMNAVIHEGDIKVSDMFNLYKYENQMYVMELTGEEIRRHLEMSYDLWVNTMTSPDDHLLQLSPYTQGDAQRMGFKNLYFNFDSAAGIDYEVDVTKPDGQKVRILRMSNGEPFSETKTYRVAVNSYRGNGGGELLTKGAGIAKDSLESRIVWRSELDQRHYFMEYIKKVGTIDPQPNHNWKFVPEAWTIPAAKRDRELLFGQRDTTIFTK
jgi:2',3'-cyclic-nucleotide 2'-phosphodiesterase/3'-nucleotidase